MSAKDYAVQDIMSDLEQNNKCFLAFRTDLDPIMDNLVSKQLQAQEDASFMKSFMFRPNRRDTQLVARCFFSKSSGEAILENYTKFYNHRPKGIF